MIKKILIISGIMFLLILLFGYFITPKEELKEAFNEGYNSAKQSQTEPQIESVPEPRQICTYSKVKVTSQRNNGKLDTREFEGCFSMSGPDDLGMIEILDRDNRVKVLYFQDEIPSLQRLNVRFGDSDPIEWRKKMGHDIFYDKKVDQVTFIFGDKNSSMGSVKGSIQFSN